MGWYYGFNSRKEAIAEQLHCSAPWKRSDGVTITRKVIARCTVGNTLWAVFEDSFDNGATPDRWIYCGLMERHGDWGYKPMEESMGPNEVSCPMSFLTLAQPEPTQGYAVEWRERVRQAAARRKGLTKGAPIVIQGFTGRCSYLNHQTGTVYRAGSRNVVVRVNGYLYKVAQGNIRLAQEGVPA